MLPLPMFPVFFPRLEVWAVRRNRRKYRHWKCHCPPPLFCTKECSLPPLAVGVKAWWRQRRRTLSTVLLALWSVAASQAIEGVEKRQALGDGGSIIPSKEEEGAFFRCCLCQMCSEPSFQCWQRGLRRKGRRAQVGVRVGHLQARWSLSPCDPRWSCKHHLRDWMRSHPGALLGFFLREWRARNGGLHRSDCWIFYLADCSTWYLICSLMPPGAPLYGNYCLGSPLHPWFLPQLRRMFTTRACFSAFSLSIWLD